MNLEPIPLADLEPTPSRLATEPALPVIEPTEDQPVIEQASHVAEQAPQSFVPFIDDVDGHYSYRLMTALPCETSSQWWHRVRETWPHSPGRVVGDFFLMRSDCIKVVAITYVSLQSLQSCR